MAGRAASGELRSVVLVAAAPLRCCSSCSSPSDAGAAACMQLHVAFCASQDRQHVAEQVAAARPQPQLRRKRRRTRPSPSRSPTTRSLTLPLHNPHPTNQIATLVAQNIMVIDTKFWMRMATRNDSAGSQSGARASDLLSTADGKQETHF